MDYALSEGCLDDSSLGPAPEPSAPGQGEEPAVAPAAAGAVPGPGEEPAALVPDGPSAEDEDKPPSSGALAALVKVGFPTGPTLRANTLVSE